MSAGISTWTPALTASPARTGCGRSSRPGRRACVSSRRRSAPGRSARKKPVTCRSSRTTRKPDARDPAPRAAAAVTLCRRSSCFSLPLGGQRDEGVGLLAAPAASRARGGPASGRCGRPARRPQQDVDRDRHQQPRQVRAGEGEVGRGREVQHAARAAARDGTRAGSPRPRQHVLDHRVAEHEVEGARRERQARAVALHEAGVGDALLARRAACPSRGSARRGPGPPRSAASSASESAVPPPPQPASSTRPRDAHARALQGLDHLRAAQVLEDRVVVLAAEARRRPRAAMAALSIVLTRAAASRRAPR